MPFGYLNQSILDSLGSIVSRYFTPKNDYYHFVGEIFDEHDNNPHKTRDTKLFKKK